MFLLEKAKVYAEFFENLSEENISTLDKFCTKDIFFKDPFNSFTGLEKFKKIFHKMFLDTKNPKFFIRDVCLSSRTAYIRWNFRYGKNNSNIEGVTEIAFNENGEIESHIDHWDSASQIFVRIPIIKYFIKFLMNKLSIE